MAPGRQRAARAAGWRARPADAATRRESTGKESRDAPRAIPGRRDHLPRGLEHRSEQGAPLVDRQRPLRATLVEAAPAAGLAAAEAAIAILHVVLRAGGEMVVQGEIVRASQALRKIEDLLRKAMHVMEVNAVDSDGRQHGTRRSHSFFASSQMASDSPGFSHRSSSAVPARGVSSRTSASEAMAFASSSICRRTPPPYA
jgi:hypothetical protein